MSHATAVAKYCSNIDALSQVVLQGDRLLKENSGDVGALRVFVSSQLDDVLMQDCTPSLDDLQAYYTAVGVFIQAHGDETAQIQVGRLFGFRPDKFKGNISISSRGPILMISFSDMQDLLYAKFAKRKEQFSHEDKTSGFYKTIHYEGHEIPVCVSFAGHDQPSTIVHELTHFRNDVIGMDFYSKGGGRDIYEVFVYDDLQEEILAFFSENYGRAEIQMAILHDQRYHFYRRIEGWSLGDKDRFIYDVSKYINIAREVKYLRPNTYLIDLAIVPLHKWERYLGYIQDIQS